MISSVIFISTGIYEKEFFSEIFNTDNCEVIQRFFSQEDELIHDEVCFLCVQSILVLQLNIIGIVHDLSWMDYKYVFCR